jgi:O-methyltransferase involved in polyketide biosynthesis
MSRPHPETISPTAHYTGYVWYAHGQSHAAFATRQGRLMYRLLRAPNAAAHALRLPTLEGMLVARHRLIDLRLSQAIEAGEVSQVIEIAAGLSPRGWRYRTRFGDRITYVEADLPEMIRRKRAVLAQLGGETSHHRTAEIDALVDSGPSSLDALCATLDVAEGTALITEGLLNYFDGAEVAGMWARFSRALARFPRAIYLADLVIDDPHRSLLVTTFQRLLGAFVRGRVHLHFEATEDIERALDAAGMDGIVHDPRDFEFELPGLERAGAGVIRVIEALPRR